MSFEPLSRRKFLRGMLATSAVTIGLPPLEALMNSTGTAYASGSAFPKRFGLFYWGNGVHPDLWIPNGRGSDWELSHQLTPFANVKDKLSVITGMEVKLPNLIAHSSGPCGFLSGGPLAGSNRDGDDDFPIFELPSIDRIIADQIGNDTRFRSVEIAIEPGAKGLSYNSPESLNPPEADPRLMFERLFGAGFRAPGDDPIIDPKLALRRSVLDAVLGDANKLRLRLGANDKARLDQHLTGIRELELRIARIESDPPNLAACVRPDQPTTPPMVDGRHNMRERSRIMSDLMVMAYACDLTRVVNYTYSDLLSNNLYPEASAGHHQLTHDEPGDMPQVQAITYSIMEDFAYYLEAMKAIPEGDGTLLDNCVILGTTDVSYARTHQIDEYPILVAGSGGGFFQTGIHYRSETKENASHIPFSLLRGLGIQVASYGKDEGYVTKGLAEIEA